MALMSDAERLWEAVNPPDLHELKLVLRDREEQLPSLCSREVNTLVFPQHPTIRDSFSVIHYAAKRGQAEILAEIFRLAEGRLNPDIKTSLLQWTPLHYAVYFGHAAACRVLVRHGASLNAVTADGSTVLHLVLKRGFRKMAHYLIDHDVFINTQDKKGHTPLVVCLQDTEEVWTAPDRFAIVDALIAKGSAVALRDECGDNALHVATRAGVDAETVSKLCDVVDGPEALQAANNYGVSPIHLAQRLEVFIKFFAKGASLAAVDDEGRTLLHSHCSNPDITQFLLSHGAKTDARDVYGRTPLQYAVTQSLPNHKAITIMLTYCNDVSSADINGNTALHDVCLMSYQGLEAVDGIPSSKPSCALLNLLLLNGAKVDACNRKGRTPLWLAIRGKKYEEAIVLLRFQADPDVDDYKGKSPRRLDAGWFKRNASLSSLKTDQTAAGPPSMLCCYGNRVARKRDSLTGLRVNYESVGVQEAWSESSEGSPVVLDVRRLQGHMINKSSDKPEADDLPPWVLRSESSDNGSSGREETSSQPLPVTSDVTLKKDVKMLKQDMKELTHFLQKLSHDNDSGTATTCVDDGPSMDDITIDRSSTDDVTSPEDIPNNDETTFPADVPNNGDVTKAHDKDSGETKCQETTQLLIREQLIMLDNEVSSVKIDLENCLADSESEENIAITSKPPSRPTAL